ncbi:putative lipopolysaccharide heptosyltransferase III [Chitinibacter sp. S2-10]|uniref:putative lipopolysaccharide heptosyltransferase III n=1 Tax=Chitinibacter sp. S2-10 TaxID=3373597 RepID=UPI003977B306
MTKSPLFAEKPPKRILLITLRYLGDTLLTTPLINSLRAAYPDARIDVLLYENTQAMLQGNPAISNLITTKPKAGWQDNRILFGKIFRQYDLAISTQTSDKAVLYAMLAAKKRIGFAPPRTDTGWFKRYFFTRYCEFDTEKTHTVLEILRLCRLLGIKPVYHLTPPMSTDHELDENVQALTAPYAVLHIMPQWRYKQWTDEGWIALARYLHEQGLQIVLSGGPADVAALNRLQAALPAGTINLAGRLSLPQWSQVLAKAAVFVGVDTGTTHLAAATQVPTVALFGPSDPVKWTPWPAHYQSDQAPFVTHGNQHVNNVYLIQAGAGQKACVPCYLEGCLRNRQSHSECLDELSAETVIDVLKPILAQSSLRE